MTSMGMYYAHAYFRKPKLVLWVIAVDIHIGVGFGVACLDY